MSEDHQHHWKRIERDLLYECDGCFAKGIRKPGRGATIEELPGNAIEELRQIVRYWDANDVYLDDLIERYIPAALDQVDVMQQELEELRGQLEWVKVVATEDDPEEGI